MAKKNKSNKTQSDAVAPEATGATLSQDDVNVILSMAQAAGLEVEEQSSFYKIARDRKALYVSKSKRALARIDLAGFSLEHPAVVPVSAEEAKAKKLGKVRGQIFPKMGVQGWHGAVEEALRVLNDGTPGIKFVRGAAEATGEEMAADETPTPRRRKARSTDIPTL